MACKQLKEGNHERWFDVGGHVWAGEVKFCKNGDDCQSGIDYVRTFGPNWKDRYNPFKWRKNHREYWAEINATSEKIRQHNIKHGIKPSW